MQHGSEADWGADDDDDGDGQKEFDCPPKSDSNAICFWKKVDQKLTRMKPRDDWVDPSSSWSSELTMFELSDSFSCSQVVALSPKFWDFYLASTGERDTQKSFTTFISKSDRFSFFIRLSWLESKLVGLWFTIICWAFNLAMGLVDLNESVFSNKKLIEWYTQIAQWVVGSLVTSKTHSTYFELQLLSFKVIIFIPYTHLIPTSIDSCIHFCCNYHLNVWYVTSVH